MIQITYVFGAFVDVYFCSVRRVVYYPDSFFRLSLVQGHLKAVDRVAAAAVDNFGSSISIKSTIARKTKQLC